MNKKYLVSILVIVMLAVGGGAFYGGMIYGKGQNIRPEFTAGNFQGVRGNRTGTTAADGSIVSGDIISSDTNSVTLLLPNNAGSKIIFFSDTTQISKYDAGTASDLTAGNSVSVMGTPNSDGSVSAQTIQIRPANQNFKFNQPANGQ